MQRSLVLQRLNSIVPPRTVLNALGRIDPFPRFAGPPVPTQPPDPRRARQPGVRGAAPSVVRIARDGLRARSRGLGLGCAARIRRDRGPRRRGRGRHDGDDALGRDAAAPRRSPSTRDNDVAVLRVFGLDRPAAAARGSGRRTRRSRSSATRRTARSTPFRAASARRARSSATTPTATGPVSRTVTSLSGQVRHGNSGGPAVNAAGAVETTVFAARLERRRAATASRRRSSGARSPERAALSRPAAAPSR